MWMLRKPPREQLTPRTAPHGKAPLDEGLRWEEVAELPDKGRLVPWSRLDDGEGKNFTDNLVRGIQDYREREETEEVEEPPQSPALELEGHTHPPSDIETINAQKGMVIQIEDEGPVWQFLKLHE